ncbi:MAG: methenyltetrahydromethanopterin cyclohydrolase [Planctomycetota bacterium]
MPIPRSLPPQVSFARAAGCFQSWLDDVALTLCEVVDIGGARVVDAGVKASGSVSAGLYLARLCMADLADIRLNNAPSDWPVHDLVSVITDHPLQACLAAQYAGWPLGVDDYFAMASGPMRSLRGREEMLEHLNLIVPADDTVSAVGVLESDSMPTRAAIEAICDQTGVRPERVCLGVAPSSSIAGSIQVVARCIETAMHKLHALDFDVAQVLSATGHAPLPVPAKPGDMVEGIGRTNDAILYGGAVTMWVDCDDDLIAHVIEQVPSLASSDHGRRFADVFRAYDHDFYKVDPMLFSPAKITLNSLQTGKSFTAGDYRLDLLRPANA